MSSFMRNLGLVLIVVAFLRWPVMVFVVPLLPFSPAKKVLLVAILTTVGAVFFWLGSLLVGKEVVQKYQRRTNVVFGSRTATSTTALTFGIPIENKLSGQVLAFPFVGGGVLTRNINGFKVDGLIVGGIDVPVSKDLTATAQVNVGFPGGDTDVGLQFGVGYNFHLF